MIITKTYTKKYEIIGCVKLETTVGDVIETRNKKGLKTPDLSKCFVCGHKFINSEYPYIAIVKGTTNNKFICSECAKKVEGSDSE